MKNIKNITLSEFYEEYASFTNTDINTLLPPGIHKEIGHFNVFDVSETIKKVKLTQTMPYNRRAYYKISLIGGKNGPNMPIRLSR